MSDFSDFLTNSATISNFTLVNSLTGGTKKIFNPVSGLIDLQCSIQPKSGDKILMAQQLQIKCSHIVYFDQNLDIKNGDRLTDENNVNYLITHFYSQGGENNINFPVFTIFADLILE